ncbi:beta-hydroxyacyl-(acyl-carrier-protein) dehydratase FabZ [Haliangium ochraceum DSM 14365]|uniref:3-hydroxyacyl-[acyl-carrier-protein] dehydratase FabZ n=2 Tax=Haliangium ochraceum TaxID=80816 RepID=D0LI90_HALO1|nr:beta-hydroxyacyl-(acyl-carrier-protein) dehydratase FabZ [Haliangium ochraceum DSM 14365]
MARRGFGAADAAVVKASRMADASTIITAQEIANLIPHRFPFLLVDRVLSVDSDKIVAIKNVSFNEPFFPGHFPGMPIMPGVLIVEAMAQAGGVLAARTSDFNPETQVVMFMAIDKVKFRKPVTPGDQLHIEVVPLRRGKIWKMQGTATVDGQVACTAEFLATMADRA